jgi:hypothetical protein
MLALAVGAALLAAAPDPATSGTPNLTKAQAMEGFYLDVARCLYALEHNGGIADLPPEAKSDLRPALPAERFLFKDPAVKVWTTDLYGQHVLIAERTADRCDVVADQLPVEGTFGQVRTRLHQADAALADQPVKGGYNPIAYQLERTAGGMRYIVHLEGSEPGGLANPGRMLMGHASRFSRLMAFVVRQPESAKPPFR